MNSNFLLEGKEIAPDLTPGSGLTIDAESRSSSAVGKRLQKLRGCNTQEEWAAELNVHKNTLARYERGERMPETDFVMTVCLKFQVNPAWLLFGTEPKRLNNVVEKARPEYSWMNFSTAHMERILSEFAFIPICDIREAAGYDALIGNQPSTMYWLLRRDWLQREIRVPETRLAVVYMPGNSMEPDLHDGDPLLVDRGDMELVREGVYVFSLDGHVFVKEIGLDEARVVVRSSGTNGGSTMKLSMLRENISFHIAAKVIGTPRFRRF